jgi:ATP-binding cassette subfamily B protein
MNSVTPKAKPSKTWLPNFWPSASGASAPASAWLSGALGCLVAVLLPLFLILVSLTVDLLIREHDRVEREGEGESVAVRLLSPFRSVAERLGDTFGVQDSQQPIVLIVLVGVVALVAIVLRTFAHRMSVLAAVETEQQLHERLFHHSNALAMERGLSAQGAMLKAYRESHLPTIRNAIAQWLDAFPKHALHLVLFVLLAATIHPWLAVAALIAGMIVRTLYLLQRQSFQSNHWLHKQRWVQSSQQLASLAQDAPLLSTIHNTSDTLESYRANLLNYRVAGQSLLGGEKSRWPVVGLTTVVLGTFLISLLALGMLDPRKHLSLGLAVLWGSSVACAIFSAYRLRLAWLSVRRTVPMLDEVHDYLAIRPSAMVGSNKRLASVLAQGIQVEHVTLQANDQQKLLEDISLHFKPGQLTAVLSPDPFLAKALVEMVLGFGQPTSGRLLFDAIDSKDLSTDVLREASLWVAANGPLVTGTIEDNLWLGSSRDATVDLREVTDKARVSEAIFNLPDGLQTLVSTKEERLSSDLLFRLGIARGFLKKPSLVVAEEPLPSQSGAEVDTTRALLELRNQKRIVLVLPNRISTLRAADQVVVLYHRGVADVGTHAELLERSELYRHWNYMHFAPRPQ